MKDIEEIIKILYEIRSIVDSNQTDVGWSKYNSVQKVLSEIDTHINKLKNNDLSNLYELEILFGPTGSFQEISISSGWEDKYINISSRFNKAIGK